MKQVKCDACGKVEDTPESRDLSTGAVPPKGWRSISTTIVEHGGDGVMLTSEGNELLSCDDCNAQMSVDEHHEAEFLQRQNTMGTPVQTTGSHTND